MPRQTRQFEIGGIYHVINRGVEQRNIFLKNQDYSRFILGLEFFNRDTDTDLWDYLGREQISSIKNRLISEREIRHERIVELCAFALMSNHFHLIVKERRKDGISLFMRKIGGYSTYFNKQYKRTGTLFQSRFKAVPIFTEEQLDTIFAYVHTNPIELKEHDWKNGTVRDFRKALQWLEKYEYSSYRDYIGCPTFPHTIDRTFFLGRYKTEKKCRGMIEEWVRSKAKFMREKYNFD